ncbi:hypothetical protein IFU39_16960 [Paenibacillus sp. CFBP 13594]|uniref:hypothetical protein n=1 Tax=Paenibacillus sp. CFBP 13594 TaxID=2774037 RepID=UPI001786D121|nr:hypothetical protein [Paenibacillus sp. CFBP 13594]MBD8839504.1 hypothetical protein [Paenibacillus sp. CFBP 13594]
MKTEVSVFSKKKKQQAMKVIEKMEASYEFYSDEVKKSKKLPDSYFTNFLHESTKQEVKGGVISVFTDHSIVDTLKGDYVRLNTKIINCLRQYYPSLTDNKEVFKSNLQDIAGNPRPVRIFSIADIDLSQHKCLFQIILIDPFHLVIPSDHGGLNSREMEQQAFNSNSRNEVCMSTYVENMQRQR